MAITNKSLRQLKRQSRRSLSDADRFTANTSICQQILHSDAYREANHIAAFKSFDGEVDLTEVIEHCWQDKKIVYLPVILGLGKPLLFVPYQQQDTLIIAEYGIERPDHPKDLWVEPHMLDLVLTPLVAFSSNKHRMGMGAGYYDRSFAFKKSDPNHKPILLGVAYDCQRSEEITIEEWDVPLDSVVTETRFL